MALPYEQFEDDIGVAEDEQSLSSGEYGDSMQRESELAPPICRVETSMQGQQLSSQLGWLHFVTGVILVVLGVVQVIVLPLILDQKGDVTQISLSHRNCYGVVIWAGLMMALSGIVGVRAALYKSTSVLYVFFILILLEIAVFGCILLYILASYTEHLITMSAYDSLQGGQWLFGVQLAGCILLAIAFVLLVHAFLQNYEYVCCSAELQLCKRVIHCCLPCFCPRVVSAEDLMADSRQRPPSLPI